MAKAIGRGSIFFKSRDLDALPAQFRGTAIAVDGHVDQNDFDRFGWSTDPDGMMIELCGTLT